MDGGWGRDPKGNRETVASPKCTGGPHKGRNPFGTIQTGAWKRLQGPVHTSPLCLQRAEPLPGAAPSASMCCYLFNSEAIQRHDSLPGSWPEPQTTTRLQSGCRLHYALTLLLPVQLRATQPVLPCTPAQPDGHLQPAKGSVSCHWGVSSSTLQAVAWHGDSEWGSPGWRRALCSPTGFF